MQVQIRLNAKAEHKSAGIVTSKEVLLEELPEIELIPEHPWQGYYTYAKGSCQSFSTDITDAIKEADDQMGVVVDSSLKSVWKRAKRLVCSPITLPEDYHVEDMQAFGPEAEVYDLTGCKLTQTLYYVSEGMPVLITRENGKKALILGYDSANVWVYDAESRTTIRKAISDAESEFSMHNCRYTVYLQ